jgi:succinyl-diaminopimelate desuccinylase
MVSFFVDEEAGGMEAGSMWLVKSGYMDNVIAALDPEPSDMRIRYVFKGRTIHEIAVSGKTAHTSTPERGINAVSKMGKILVALDNARLKVEPHKLLGACTRSFTAIEGGRYKPVNL